MAGLEVTVKRLILLSANNNNALISPDPFSTDDERFVFVTKSYFNATTTSAVE